MENSATRPLISILSTVTCVLGIAVLLSVPAYLSYAVPRWQEIFRNLDTELPTLTILVLSVPWTITTGLGVGGAMALGFKEWKIRDRYVTLAINALAILATVIVFEVYRWALMLPVSRLFENAA